MLQTHAVVVVAEVVAAVEHRYALNGAERFAWMV